MPPVLQTRTPVYTTATDLDAFSSAIAGSSLAIADKENLILRAEAMIDALVGYHPGYYRVLDPSDPQWEDQQTVFPRVCDVDENDDPFIPWEITQSALKLCVLLFETESSGSSLSQLSLLQPGDSITHDDFSYSRGNTSSANTAGGESVRTFLHGSLAGKEILSMLENFTSFTFSL